MQSVHLQCACMRLQACSEGEVTTGCVHHVHGAPSTCRRAHLGMARVPLVQPTAASCKCRSSCGILHSQVGKRQLAGSTPELLSCELPRWMLQLKQSEQGAHLL